MNLGQRFEGVIEALAFGGDGVAHAPDGLTVFVPYAAPGDKATFEVSEPHKTYARARILSILKKGPGRAEAPCPVFGDCGGCQWQHLSYPAQLEAKENFVRESLRRIGGFAEPPVRAIAAAAQPLAYRNKAIVPVGAGDFGFYRASSHEIVGLPEAGCAIQSEPSNRALRFLMQHAGRIPGLRHAAVRANSQGEMLIALVSALPLELDAEPWLTELEGLKGVVNNLQPKPGNAVFGSETRVLSGKSFIVEELDGLKFRLSATSFFQVNSAQAVALWKRVLAARNWKAGESVLELYCGVGTLSLPLARLGVDLLGIENWAVAVEDARLNAGLNALGSARFECADAREGFRLRPNPAVLLLDPPRKGLSAEVLGAIISAKPQEILYVSCDPASLSRDLKALAGAGWTLESVQPLDMFPQTYHVESLALLRR
jgi:23S rRNA (uracil1939-C5)-methyltransferase